ncbi:histidine kinase [Devosia insulae DS-56]|uniref:Blue-light-activated histidine kinase n=1 Tax=Devosia insulae DS-56 TaxID=1116389 RepID=A0A1E5XLM8_9HYPH|nr:PAS domain S-box protein [Devosia insulae]OEO29482.1 histidine kinase [Devosia insulae DS-56]
MQDERENLDEGGRIVEARLAAIIDSSFDAVIAKDLNSIITDWNPAAERMFGYSADEAIGRSILMLIPPHLRNEETDIIRRIRANERVESYETVRLRKDGSTVFVSLTVSPIRNPRGEVVGASKIARDITQTKESERRIRVLLREINHRVKNQYAVILSLIRETGLSSVSIDEFQAKIRTRIASLAASHDLLVRSEWTGSTLAELVKAQLAPFGHESLVTISGPLVSISPNAVQNLGMAFHELGTNSAKYGVLSGAGGAITVSWSVSREPAAELTLTWDESFDEPLVPEPRAGRGFGTVVLERVAPFALNGRASISRSPSRITWTLEAPASSVLMEQAGADGDA